MKTVNEVRNAYTFYLDAKRKQLFGMLKNPNVSLDTMKKNIRNYIYNATYSYPTKLGFKMYTKKKWFLDILDSLETKESVYYFCINSIRKAKETEAQ